MNRTFSYLFTIAFGIFSCFSNAQGACKSLGEAPGGASGNNVVSIAPFSVNNRGLCLGLSYERFLDHYSRISFYVPVLYNHRQAQQYENDFYSQKNLSLYAGFKYYATRSSSPVRYAVGLLAGDALSFRYVTGIQNHGGYVEPNITVLNSLAGFMIHNSLNVLFAKHFAYSMELDLGICGQSVSNSQVDQPHDSMLPFVLLQMSFGYRF